MHAYLSYLFFMLATIVGILVCASIIFTIFGFLFNRMFSVKAPSDYDQTERFQNDVARHTHTGAASSGYTPHATTGNPLPPPTQRHQDELLMKNGGPATTPKPAPPPAQAPIVLGDESTRRDSTRTPMRTRTDVRKEKRKRAMAKNQKPAPAPAPAKKGSGGKGKGKK